MSVDETMATKMNLTCPWKVYIGDGQCKTLFSSPLPPHPCILMMRFLKGEMWRWVSWTWKWYGHGLWTHRHGNGHRLLCLPPSPVFVNVFSIRWYEEGREGREDTCLAPVMRPPWVIHTPSTTLCNIQGNAVQYYLRNTVRYLNKYGAIFNKLLWNTEMNTVQYLKEMQRNTLEYIRSVVTCSVGWDRNVTRERDAAHRPITASLLVWHSFTWYFALYFICIS